MVSAPRLPRASRFAFLALGFSAALSTACSRTPAVSLGRESLAAKVKSESGGQILLAAFAKTNGILREIAGQQMYSMEFTATVRFQRGSWKGGDAIVGYFNDFAVASERPGGWSGFGQNWKYFERKAELQVKGVIQFEGTERGWRSTETEIKSVSVLTNLPDSEYYDRYLGYWVNRNPDGSSLQIVKSGSQYRYIDQRYSSETELHAENQALTFRDLDMPVYLRLDEAGRQLYMGPGSPNRYDRVDDADSYRRLAAGTVAAATAAPAPAVAPAPAPALARKEPFMLKAVIDDRDGYTNVREAGASTAGLLDVVRDGEVFFTFQQEGSWWRVKLANGKTGFIHRSRIKLVP